MNQGKSNSIVQNEDKNRTCANSLAKTRINYVILLKHQITMITQLLLLAFCIINYSISQERNRSDDGNDNPSSRKLGIAEKKCREYTNKISETVYSLQLSLDATPVPRDIKKCDYESMSLIIGGEPASRGEFPFMAAIGYRIDITDELSWLCGGTLISERFVITAAHCTNVQILGLLKEPVNVRLGDLDLASSDDGANYDIEQIIKHPDYKSPQKYNDIALLKVRNEIIFNQFIRPACLWNGNLINENKVVATGWGSTVFGENENAILRKVVLKIFRLRICKEKYGTYTHKSLLPNGLIDSMICAGDLEGGKDTCQGDSGGPLFLSKSEDRCIFYVLGVTSFGRGCGCPNSPAIYTNISSYLPWIEKTVW